jgi:hypothetical protein
MFSRTITAAAALAAAVAVSTAVHRYRRLHRVLARERAAHRLMDGCLHRDLAAFQSRIDAAAARLEAERAVLVEAGRAVDDALAVHGAQLNNPNDPIDPYDPQEGGPV